MQELIGLTRFPWGCDRYRRQSCWRRYGHCGQYRYVLNRLGYLPSPFESTLFNVVFDLVGGLGKTVGDTTTGLTNTVGDTTKSAGNTVKGVTSQEGGESGEKKQSAQNPLGL